MAKQNGGRVTDSIIDDFVQKINDIGCGKCIRCDIDCDDNCIEVLSNFNSNSNIKKNVCRSCWDKYYDDYAQPKYTDCIKCDTECLKCDIRCIKCGINCDNEGIAVSYDGHIEQCACYPCWDISYNDLIENCWHVYCPYDCVECTFLFKAEKQSIQNELKLQRDIISIQELTNSFEKIRQNKLHKWEQEEDNYLLMKEIYDDPTGPVANYYKICHGWDLTNYDWESTFNHT